MRALLGFQSDERIVLTVARLTEQKGHRRLLAAIPEALDRDPRLRFVWAGDGELEPELRQAIVRANLADRVLLLGHRTDVADLTGAADLFVLTSDYEGLPLAVLEALAAGLPVVATRVPGIAETIEHGETGLLVDPGDREGLTDAIVKLADPDVARAFAAPARASRALRFSAERMARGTLAVYRRALAAGRDVVGARLAS